MKTNWQEFKASEHFGLIQNRGVDLKLFNGRLISVYQVVGVTILDNKNEIISYQDIGWCCQKKDWNRYNNLQKHYQLLQKYDQETLDDLGYAISGSLDFGYNSLEDEKLTKLFKKLNNYIKKAQEQILTESKTYL